MALGKVILLHRLIYRSTILFYTPREQKLEKKFIGMLPIFRFLRRTYIEIRCQSYDIYL